MDLVNFMKHQQSMIIQKPQEKRSPKTQRANQHRSYTPSHQSESRLSWSGKEEGAGYTHFNPSPLPRSQATLPQDPPEKYPGGSYSPLFAPTHPPYYPGSGNGIESPAAAALAYGRHSPFGGAGAGAGAGVGVGGASSPSSPASAQVVVIGSQSQMSGRASPFIGIERDESAGSFSPFEEDRSSFEGMDSVDEIFGERRSLEFLPRRLRTSTSHPEGLASFGVDLVNVPERVNPLSGSLKSKNRAKSPAPPVPKPIPRPPGKRRSSLVGSQPHSPVNVPPPPTQSPKSRRASLPELGPYPFRRSWSTNGSLVNSSNSQSTNSLSTVLDPLEEDELESPGDYFPGAPLQPTLEESDQEFLERDFFHLNLAPLTPTQPVSSHFSGLKGHAELFDDR